MNRKTPATDNEVPSKIITGFWIGSFEVLANLDFIEKNVDTIVNVSREIPRVVAWGKRYRHYHLGYFFNEDSACWKTAIDVVKALHEERREGKRILLNCLAGIDRSPTIGAKFLAEEKKITLLDAAALIQKARPIAFPHLSWWERPRNGRSFNSNI